jgi:CHAT domain-containing protein/tetratricopeptide (TPR) repeat protein
MARRFHEAIWALCSTAVLLCACTAPRPERTFDECSQLAERQVKNGSLPAALETAGRCLALASTESELRRARVQMADVFLRTGSAGRAVELLTQPEPAFRTGDDPDLRIRYLLTLGYAEVRTNHPASGRTRLEEAARLAHDSGRPALEAGALVRIANAVTDPDAKTSFLRRALELAQRSGSSYEEAEVRGSFGFACLAREHFSEAVEWLQSAIPLVEGGKAVNLEQNILGNLGWCYYKLGEPELAIEVNRKAAALAAQCGNVSDQLQWLNTMANSFSALDQPRQAMETYQAALVLARRHGLGQRAGTLLNNLAEVSLSLGDTGHARQYFVQSMESKRGKASAESLLFAQLTDSEILIREGKVFAAEQKITESLQSEAATPTVRRGLYFALAETYRRTGRMDEADHAYRKALGIVMEGRTEVRRQDFRLSYSSAVMRYYAGYVDFLMHQNRPLEALRIADSSRTEEFEARLGPSGMLSAAAWPSPTFIAGNRRATVLVYWLQPERSYLWVVTSQGVETRVLPPKERIEALVARYHLELDDPLRAQPQRQAAAQALYRVLIEHPVPPPLQKGRVIIIADGALHRLNFETLIHTDPVPHYWIEDAVISRAPSLMALERARNTPHMRKTQLLLVGNPNLTGSHFPPLPRAGEEMERIAAGFGQANTTRLEGEAATVAGYENANPSRFDYIHFATHGIASDKRPLDSAILLSGNPVGNRVAARDIVRVPLRARLVSLGACFSAGSRTYQGTGLIGLGWAFLRAGAQSVIAGLWAVNDSASLQLHSSLYRHLREGGEPAEALREAKLAMLHSGSPLRKPYYWGAWTLMEGRP